MSAFVPVFFFLVEKKVANRKSNPENQHHPPDPYRGSVTSRNSLTQSINSRNDQQNANNEYKQVPTAFFHFFVLLSLLKSFRRLKIVF
jgi:hypothetical protein